jgi:cell division protease FtsH
MTDKKDGIFSNIKRFLNNHKLITILLVVAIALIIYKNINNTKTDVVDVPLSEAIALSQSQSFSEMLYYPDEEQSKIKCTISDNVTTTVKDTKGTIINLTGGDKVVSDIGAMTIKDLSDIGFILPPLYTTEQPTSSAWINLISNLLLPVMLVIGMYLYFTGRIGFGAGNKFKSAKSKVSFNDIGGMVEIKDNLKEVVSFLKNREAYEKVGAKIPRGILLEGASGVGKTLLAKAIATEANVPFYYTSGSEFHNMWVGMAAMRVKQLFKSANKTASIVFIDEFDSIAEKRGGSHTDVGREWNHTLNQLLTEMDGFKDNSKIVVLAATNRVDALDPAVLRAGRFDRKITVPLPNYEARLEILQIHSKGKQLSNTVKFEDIAKQTSGFTGADIALLINESAINAAKENMPEISRNHILQAMDRILVGDTNKGHKLTEQERKLLAYHESGHAIVASFIPHCDKVQRITILQHGQVGGYTRIVQETEPLVLSKTKAISSIATLLGGRVSEELVMNDITSSAQDDIKRANLIAREMVEHYGMSEQYGLRYNEQGMYGINTTNSEASKLIEVGINDIIKQSYDMAKQIIQDKRQILDKLANKLLELDTLESEDIEKVINGE